MFYPQLPRVAVKHWLALSWLYRFLEIQYTLIQSTCLLVISFALMFQLYNHKIGIQRVLPSSMYSLSQALFSVFILSVARFSLYVKSCICECSSVRTMINVLLEGKIAKESALSRILFEVVYL